MENRDESALAEDDPRLMFLRHHGADAMGHSHQTLLAHLCGTYALLHAWGQPAHVCDAGLFHSVYGTEVYRQVALPTTLRPEVKRFSISCISLRNFVSFWRVQSSGIAQV